MTVRTEYTIYGYSYSYYRSYLPITANPLERRLTCTKTVAVEGENPIYPTC